MDLILWRHAEAQDALGGMSDLDRPLTPKGLRQAEAMARWLHAQLPKDTRVLVSPALRTQQTVQPLQRAFSTVQALAPDASVQAVLQAVDWAGNAGTVLVVGHQPTLGLVAAQLLAGSPLPWSVRKGAIWWLRRRSDGREVTLQVVLSPDRL